MLVAGLDLACSLLLTLSICRALPVDAPVIPGRALVFSAYGAPLQVDFNRTELGPKIGESRAFYFNVLVLSFVVGVPIDFAWGDAAIDAAAREGDIQRISHADYEVLNVLGFGMIKVRVYGE